ncbi:MAG: peptide deformylase [Deltaproteobacteria bacterium]|jgi:peptide deformylase|nr:peptide deformylase [Deltaproteobacteria bacterium]
MAILPILKYPDIRLRQVAKEVTVFDEHLAQLAADMEETMFDSKGVGIAAPQVGQSLSLFLVNYGKEKDGTGLGVVAFVNPKIEKCLGKIESEEGCLSVVDFRAKVTRASYIEVTAQDLNGEYFSVEHNDHFATVLQHELDHLVGTLFVDHISHIKREAYNKKLAQDKKERDKKARAEETKRMNDDKADKVKIITSTPKAPVTTPAGEGD